MGIFNHSKGKKIILYSAMYAMSHTVAYTYLTSTASSAKPSWLLSGTWPFWALELIGDVECWGEDEVSLSLTIWLMSPRDC